MGFGDFISPLDQQQMGGDDILSRVSSLEQAVKYLQTMNVEFNSSDEGATDAGVMTSGEYRCVVEGSDSSDPTDTGFTGTFISGVGQVFGSDTYNIGSVAAGVLQWGANIAGKFIAIAGGFVIDASGMSLTVGGNMVMQITGAYAKFGSNVAAANTTAFAIFFTAQTYNGESMEAGAVLFGSNSSTYANVMWQPSTKRLLFRNGTSTQAYVDTTGAITLGNGTVIGNANGWKIITTITAEVARSYGFTDSGLTTEYGGLYGADTGGFNAVQLLAKAVALRISYVSITANSPSGRDGRVLLTASETGGKNATIDMQAVAGGQAFINVGGGYDVDISLQGQTDSAAVFVEASTNNVGIGTNSPSAKFNVEGSVVINDAGADKDVRIEGDTDANLLFTDASTDRVGVGTNTPSAKFNVEGAVIINDAGADVDVRVEGDTDANLLFVDASIDRVGIGMNNPARKLDVTGTFGATGAATFGSTVAATGNVTGANLSGTNTGDQTLKTPIYSSGLGNTVAGASTAYLGMHPQAPNATESNVQAQAPFNGTKKNLRLRTLTAQPAGGNMVVTLRVGGSDTSVTFTIAAGAGAGTFSDVTNSASITAAQAESIKCVNNAAGASAQIGQYSLEYDAT